MIDLHIKIVHPTYTVKKYATESMWKKKMLESSWMHGIQLEGFCTDEGEVTVAHTRAAVVEM